jgi:hypothetical protein
MSGALLHCRGVPGRNSNWRARVFAPAVSKCQEADESLPSITPHDLRHTAASPAIGAGANVKAVQRMLGHAKASMPRDTNADLFDTDLTRYPSSSMRRSKPLRHRTIRRRFREPLRAACGPRLPRQVHPHTQRDVTPVQPQLITAQRCTCGLRQCITVGAHVQRHPGTGDVKDWQRALIPNVRYAFGGSAPRRGPAPADATAPSGIPRCRRGRPSPGCRRGRHRPGGAGLPARRWLARHPTRPTHRSGGRCREP